jgi:hypothetical protein
MIQQPNCSIRNCKHYLGVNSEEEEENERNCCKAFPDKIPDEIAYGDNLHLSPLSEQESDLIYVKK